MNIKKNIPNVITCGNLLCGCLATLSAFNTVSIPNKVVMSDNLVWCAYLVGIAAVLDFFDGFVARLLKVGGEMGKQLDSLADMVTFGVVPGAIMYKLIRLSSMNELIGIYDGTKTTSTPMLYFYWFSAYIAFLIPIFSAIRLAKFNIDTRQTTSFIGVPTPANAILICSLPLITTFQPTFLGFDITHIISNIYFLISLTLIMSYLLVAELPLFALKFKTFKWVDNKIRYIFLIISLVLLILFQFIAIPFIIFLYIVLSIINNTINKNEIQSRN